MAGRVRQPIDEKKLEKYLQDNVPEVKTPVELKQVGQTPRLRLGALSKRFTIADMCAYIVWLRPVQSHIPAHSRRWQALCHAQEASGQAPLQDGAQG